MESFIKTIRFASGVEKKIELFADRNIKPKRKGWSILKAKSHTDGRTGKEMFSAVFVDGIKFMPGAEFQCHPKHAEILISKDQVTVVKQPASNGDDDAVAASE